MALISGELKNIWEEADYINPASETEISNAEARLGVTFPSSLRKQLEIQNGGELIFCCWCEQAEGLSFEFVADSTVDGILPVEDWELASQNDWFSNNEEISNPELLISIAGHSEDQLCLDYRKNGPAGEPGITAFFITQSPPEINSYESITRLMNDIIQFKETHEPPE